eukprot:scaffold41567_cov36-Phaeocystis_antarctica.AAC.1
MAAASSRIHRRYDLRLARTHRRPGRRPGPRSYYDKPFARTSTGYFGTPRCVSSVPHGPPRARPPSLS